MRYNFLKGIIGITDSYREKQNKKYYEKENNECSMQGSKGKRIRDKKCSYVWVVVRGYEWEGNKYCWECRTDMEEQRMTVELCWFMPCVTYIFVYIRQLFLSLTEDAKSCKFPSLCYCFSVCSFYCLLLRFRSVFFISLPMQTAAHIPVPSYCKSGSNVCMTS